MGAPDINFAEIEKNSRESIRVSLRTFRGYRSIDLRIYVDGDDGSPCPTQKGVSMRPELVDEVIDALRQARDAARREGLLA